jgi:hypothetical protein
MLPKTFSVFFCCGYRGFWYLSLMSAASILIAIGRLQRQLEVCEDFSDWDGCERIEEEIAVLEAMLEEKSLTNP